MFSRLRTGIRSVSTLGTKPSIIRLEMSHTATAEGTASYAERFADATSGYFKPFGRTGLTVSAFGFGGYRVVDNSELHRRSLSKALLHGCNLVDTSSNYTGGGSERLVGQVISQLIEEGELSREEVVVVTKVGYAQGENLELLQRADQQGAPYDDVVRYADGCWHCIHRKFLEAQLERSLTRLDMSHVDVYLLHNPEYYLSDAQHRGEGSLDERRREYDRRIAVAFDWLEGQVDAGRIGSYGISSNTFPASTDDPEHTSLERMIELAKQVRTAHHFSTIQLPMNLLERGGVTEKNQRERQQNVLDLARENGLGVLINRPLNAITSTGLVRLADVAQSSRRPDEIRGELDAALGETTSIEASIMREVAKHSDGSVDTVHIERQLGIAATLERRWTEMSSLEHWNDIVERSLVPAIAQLTTAIQARFGEEHSLMDQLRAYSSSMLGVLRLIGEHYGSIAQHRATAIAAAVDGALVGDVGDSMSLSRTSLWLLSSLPQVSTVLVGMRRPEYVDDVLGLASRELLEGAEGVFEKLDAGGAIEGALEQ